MIYLALTSIVNIDVKNSENQLVVSINTSFKFFHLSVFLTMCANSINFGTNVNCVFVFLGKKNVTIESNTFFYVYYVYLVVNSI